MNAIKHVSTKQLVKTDAITIAEAMNRVPPDSKTYGWLKRRSERKRAGK
jgi:hypothetical protein